MDIKEFEERYNALSDITKKRTANALKGKGPFSEEVCIEILKFAEAFDKLVQLGVAK